MSNASKAVTLLVLALVALSIMAAIRDESVLSAREAAQAATKEPWRLHEIHVVRHRAQVCMQYLTGHRYDVSTGLPLGPRYRRWVLRLWRARYTGCVVNVAATERDPRIAIRLAFGVGATGEAAIRVSACETGGTFDTDARNGQYLGLFQMGLYARARYGHGTTALSQARAAHRYFLESGWRPWSCQP